MNDGFDIPRDHWINNYDDVKHVIHVLNGNDQEKVVTQLADMANYVLNENGSNNTKLISEILVDTIIANNDLEKLITLADTYQNHPNRNNLFTAKQLFIIFMTSQEITVKLIPFIDYSLIKRHLFLLANSSHLTKKPEKTEAVNKIHQYILFHLNEENLNDIKNYARNISFGNFDTDIRDNYKKHIDNLIEQVDYTLKIKKVSTNNHKPNIVENKAKI